MIEPPKPTGRAPQKICLTDKLFPWQMWGPSEGGPVFLEMPGSPHLYLPCFSDETKLREVLARAEVTFECIKKITDGGEFLTSVPRVHGQQEVRIIIDPWFTPEGRVRFTEVKWD